MKHTTDVAQKKDAHQEDNEAREASLEKKLVLSVKRTRVFPSFAQCVHLPHLLRRPERTIFFIAFVVFVVSSILLIGNLTHTYRSLLPRTGGSYTEAVIGQPKLINPLWAQANAVDRDLTRLIFAGIYRYTSDLTLELDLAKSVDISEDQKTYTITLKNDLRWHDGKPLTVRDVAFTIRAAQNPAYGSTRSADFKNVVVEVIDDSTLKLRLDHVSAPFLHALTLGILPEHLWSAIPAEVARLAELNTKPVGAGPYQFEKLRKTKTGTIHSYKLEQNSKYRGQPPFIKTLTFRFFTDYRTAIQALAQGNVEGMAFVPYELRNELTRQKNLVFHELYLSQITALFFNQQKNKILGEKLLREALAHAIDKSIIISEGFHNNAQAIDGPLLPESIGFTNEVRTYPFSKEHAAELLDGNGWKFVDENTTRTFVPANKQDKRFSEGTKLSLSLVTVDVPEYVRTAELIRDAWQENGIAVELSVVNPAALERDVLAERTFDVLLYGEILGADPDPYPFWHSSQIKSPGVNLAQYANRRVDGLLEETRTLHDKTERAKRYEEFQKIITSELPAIFLLTPSYTYAIRDHVRGISTMRLGSPEDRFTSISHWFVKTKLWFW